MLKPIPTQIEMKRPYEKRLNAGDGAAQDQGVGRPWVPS